MKLWSIILFAILLVSCTDYVNQIEDERDEWRTTREQAALLTSSEIVGLSSSIELKYSSSVVLSGDSHEESSSSDTKSCSSEKLSSSSKDGEPIDVSSSSSVNSKNSSSSAISSSDGSEETSSSSSVILSGDSHEESSSSENVKSSSSGKASWAYLNPAISYGEMIDNRDGQVYKTVVIGEQTWMAENLNYKVGRICFNNETDKCNLYGGFYVWNDALTICPNGWHLPSVMEFEELVSVAGDSTTAGKILKSKTEWKNDGNGSDSLGFSGLPLGRYITYNTQQVGLDADFWSSSKCPGYYGSGAYIFGFRYDKENAYFSCTDLKDNYSSRFYPVRCLKDASLLSSSSESIPSSSSKASWAYLNPAISYGEMIDDRDGQVYKTIVIGEQTWMAENLNYEFENSHCFNDSALYCAKYGRYYTWAATMDSAGIWSSNGKGCGNNQTCSPTYPVRGICAKGWHLPTSEEWSTLLTKDDFSKAGQVLKSAIGWIENQNGIDSYGFSVIPAGNKLHGYSWGQSAYFWTSTEYNRLNAYYIYFEYDNGNASQNDYKSDEFSVRCVKD